MGNGHGLTSTNNANLPAHRRQAFPQLQDRAPQTCALGDIDRPKSPHHRSPQHRAGARVHPIYTSHLVATGGRARASAPLAGRPARLTAGPGSEGPRSTKPRASCIGRDPAVLGRAALPITGAATATSPAAPDSAGGWRPSPAASAPCACPCTA
jgi:hypothetical protein